MRKPIVVFILACTATLTTAVLPVTFPLSVNFASAAVKEQPLQLVINGEVVTSFPPPLRMDNNTLYAPARFFFEKIGCTVTWDENNRTLTAMNLVSNITFTPGTDVLLINQLVVRINDPSKFWDDSTWVPIRAVSEALGAEVKWNGLTQTMFVKSGVSWAISSVLSMDGTRLTYEGESKNGIREGNGKLFVDGILWYEGTFSQNRMEGSGRLYDRDRLVYEGAFADNMPNGQGILHYPNGDSYGGEFSSRHNITQLNCF